MCEICVQALEIMTKKTDKEFAEYWLWNETAFPVGTPELILKQAKDFVPSPKYEKHK